MKRLLLDLRDWLCMAATAVGALAVVVVFAIGVAAFIGSLLGAAVGAAIAAALWVVR